MLLKSEEPPNSTRFSPTTVTVWTPRPSGTEPDTVGCNHCRVAAKGTNVWFNSNILKIVRGMNQDISLKSQCIYFLSSQNYDITESMVVCTTTVLITKMVTTVSTLD